VAQENDTIADMKAVIENFLKDPMSLRQKALHTSYQDLLAPDGETYKRVCPIPGRLLERRLSAALGVDVDINLAVIRCNFRLDYSNQSIHFDSSFSNHAAVLHLSPDDLCQGGTALWRHRATGLDAWPYSGPDAEELLKVQTQLCEDFTDPSKFEMTELILAKFNQLAVYPADMFHSRWIGDFLPADQVAKASDFEGYGETLETGRLILAIFFNTLTK
jgi:hypothetical protein